MLFRVAVVSGVNKIRKSKSPMTRASSSRRCIRSNPVRLRGAEVTPTTRMPKALHFGAKISAIWPTPNMPTVLSCSSCAGKRRHCRSACARIARRSPPCQCQHAGECRFRNRSAVDSAHNGDDHVLAQGRLINEIVDAGAKRLHPFQSGRGGPRLRSIASERK